VPPPIFKLPLFQVEQRCHNRCHFPLDGLLHLSNLIGLIVVHSLPKCASLQGRKPNRVRQAEFTPLCHAAQILSLPGWLVLFPLIAQFCMLCSSPPTPKLL